MSVTVLQPKTDPFDEFWRVYPRKVAKPLAKAKWHAITNGGLTTRTFDKDSNTYVDIELTATPDEIIEGARRYRESQLDQGSGSYGFKDGGRYLAHPSTWLNQGRWMDGC